MKIALVVERMDPSRGGRETSTAQIAADLARRGHDVTIICQHGQWPDESVKIRALGQVGALRSTRLVNFVLGTQQVVEDDRFDIVHTMLPVPGANVYQPRGGTVPAQVEASRRRWRSLGGLRVKLFERLNVCRRKLAQLEKLTLADPKTICLAVSAMVAEELEDYYGQSKNVRIVYNGVDLPQTDPDDWQDWRQRKRFDMEIGQDDPVFISVATNFALKGIDETIRSFAKWYGSHMGRINARLVIVGRDLVEGYERISGMLDVGKQVIFVPPTKDIFQWYAAADACILLSWYDPCSRTVLEAVRLGIPAITTVHNGASEILADGAGIVVSSPTDRRAIVAALDELADPQRRAERREACLTVADTLSTARHVDQLLEVYAEATGAA